MSCTASGYRLKDSDYPAVPEKSGYTGTWTKYTDAIVSDIQVNATYKRTTPVPTVRPTGGVVASLTEEPTEPDVPPVEEELMEDLEPQESPAEQENTQTEPIATQAQMTTTHTVQHDYVTQSGRLVREKVTEDGTLTAVMDFVYDESGRPLAVLYSTNGTDFTTYYYILNLQGDVVKLIGTDGSIAASYTYDAWGNILLSSGTMAEKNPLRYRGYYYDSETGYYYLQSRYYDPTTRRFLNADSFASTGQGFVGTNMFAYCGNNPTSRIDPTGQSFADIWEFIEDAISEIGSAFKELTPVFTSCGGFAAADGPLPIGDIVGASIAVGAAFGIVGYGVYRAAKPKSRATESSADDEAIAAIAASAIRPLSSLVFFPEDPNDFRPRGLYLKKYDGSTNGKIYLWVDPVTDIPIFEWNEDLAHEPHYHVMLLEWKGEHHGLHYWAGEPVPEPWSSIYFGG